MLKGRGPVTGVTTPSERSDRDPRLTFRPPVWSTTSGIPARGHTRADVGTSGWELPRLIVLSVCTRDRRW